MALIEPTKSRDKLDEDRLRNDPRPVVVMERPGGGKARVLDGNHVLRGRGRETRDPARCAGDTLEAARLP